MAKPNGFGDIMCKKLLSDPSVLLLVTAAMFWDGSKIPISVLCSIPPEIFIPSPILIGQVVSEKIFERNNIKNSKETSKE